MHYIEKFQSLKTSNFMAWSLMVLKLMKVQKDQKYVSSWTVKILLFDTENNRDADFT